MVLASSMASGMVVSVGGLDGFFDGNRGAGAFRSTASSSSRIWNELFFSISSSLVFPLPTNETKKGIRFFPRPTFTRKHSIRDGPRTYDILRLTLIVGFQSSSGCFGIRLTCMWMEGLLYAIRGSSSFAKCLGVAS